MTGQDRFRGSHEGNRRPLLRHKLLLPLVLAGLLLRVPSGVAGEETAAACHPRPIVFLHGHFYTNASLTVLIDRFEADGWPRERLATIEVSRKACTDAWADTLAERVDVLRRETGCPRVDIVAYSRGGLAARAYIQRGNNGKRVAHLVTLGTPHHGAAINRAFPGCGCLEMRPGSDFLRKLNAKKAPPRDTVLSSIYSRHDEFVPAESAWLPGARNIEVRGAKHSDLLRSRRVYMKIRGGLM